MSETVKRTASIEEASNAVVFHRLSSWIVPFFARMKMTPNMVSIMGMTSGAVGGISYYYYDISYGAPITGFLLMAIWHVMDGADGQLARLTNTQSEIGKIIDGICDYVVFIAVYVSLALAMTLIYGPSIWFLIVAAGLCHAVQAGAYELHREEFGIWGQGKGASATPTEAGDADRSNMGLGARVANNIGKAYAKMQSRFSGLDPEFHEALERHLAKDSVDEKEFREQYQAAYAPMVRGWGIMCANYRTYAIFISCVIGYPVIYFLLEAIVLPMVHIYLARKQRKFNTTFLKGLEVNSANPTL